VLQLIQLLKFARLICVATLLCEMSNIALKQAMTD